MNASVSALIVGLLLTLLVPATQGLGQTAGDDCRRQVDAALEGAVTVRTRPRGEIADLLLVLRNRPYPEAYDAGIKLLREPEFSDGRSLGEIVGVLGRPDSDVRRERRRERSAVLQHKWRSPGFVIPALQSHS